MNNEYFYENLDLRYPEIAIALESGYKSIKAYIPVLMPFVDNIGNKPKEEKSLAPIKSKILNKESLKISKTTTQNYINLDISNIGKVDKGDRVVIVFISGDPNKPIAIGRC